MKRQNWKRAAALLSAVFLTVMVTSCQKADAPDDDTTLSQLETSSEEILTEESTELPQESETDTTKQTNPAPPVQQPVASGPTANQPKEVIRPTNAAKAVALFNEAIPKILGVEATYNYKMDKYEMSLVGQMDADTTEFDAENRPLPNPKITPLEESSIASYQLEEQGNQYVLRFQLKEFYGNAASTYGDGGYLYFNENSYEQLSELLSKYRNPISSNSFEIEKDRFQITLTDGELVAAIDKTSGKLSQVTVSFHEKMIARLNIKYQGRASFTCYSHGDATFICH